MTETELRARIEKIDRDERKAVEPLENQRGEVNRKIEKARRASMLQRVEPYNELARLLTGYGKGTLIEVPRRYAGYSGDREGIQTYRIVSFSGGFSTNYDNWRWDVTYIKKDGQDGARRLLYGKGEAWTVIEVGS